MDTFKSDIKTYIDRLETAINKTKQDMAKDAVFNVVAESPVRSGRYVESHNIGINAIDSSHLEPWNGPFLQPMNSGHAMQLKVGVINDLEKMVNRTKFTDIIYLSNSIPYAGQVEYIGWPQYGVEAKHPYGKAALRLKAKTYLKSKTNAPLK